MEQQHDTSSSSGPSRWHVALGMLAGVAVGAGIGILVAPSSGSELRRRISESATNLPRGLARASRAALEEGRQAFEREALAALRQAS